MEGICVNVVNPGQFLARDVLLLAGGSSCHAIASTRSLVFIPQGTLPWQTILGKICDMTFIQHPGILEQS